MIARLADDSDPPRLASFLCSRGSQYEDSVQDWIRHESWRWFTEDPYGPGDRRLIVLDDEDTDELLAVGAHERGGVDWERFVNVIAVRTEHRRNSDGSGPRLGKTMLATVLADAAERCPDGIATWLVDPDNRNSIIMCEKAGAEWICGPDDGGYLRFRIDL